MTILQRNSILTKRGISEEQLLFRPNGGVESADVEPAWWIDLKATSDERMFCTGGYESILGFSLSMMKSSTITPCKDDIV